MDDVVNKFEKDSLGWNGYKKLRKRDGELDEASGLLNYYLEDLMQERQNTEIELERNREK